MWTMTMRITRLRDIWKILPRPRGQPSKSWLGARHFAWGAVGRWPWDLSLEKTKVSVSFLFLNSLTCRFHWNVRQVGAQVFTLVSLFHPQPILSYSCFWWNFGLVLKTATAKGVSPPARKIGPSEKWVYLFSPSRYWDGVFLSLCRSVGSNF